MQIWVVVEPRKEVGTGNRFGVASIEMMVDSSNVFWGVRVSESEMLRGKP